MFLTEMRLNPTRSQTRRAVGSPQITHAIVMGSFPPAVSEARPLWRLDREANHELLLYVVSHAAPDMTGLTEQLGWPTTDSHRTASYEGLLDRLQPSQQWAFRLTANPTRSQATTRGSRGTRRPLRTVAQQEKWLLEKCGSWGFSVPLNSLGAPQVAVLSRDTASFTRHSPSGRPRPIHLTRATYQGVLEVRDPAVLRRVMMNGIGSGKAYGCGLLTMAPL